MKAPELDEDVRLADPDPAWGRMGAEAAQTVAGITRLGIDRIEHIGSTAVPRLVAKPVIDLMTGTDSAEATEDAARCLRAAGWDDLGEAGVPGRRYLRCRTGVSVNVHVVAHGGPIWQQNLDIRDYLRAHPREADAYGRIKRRLVVDGRRRLLAYSAAKADWVSDLARRAGQWRREQGRA